tara:strand:+ start:290 stop:535 length:246 start_codon:yes stop_codon:yes gene_type:complete
MNQQKIAEDYKNKLLAQTAELMHQLATPAAFLKYYYKILPKCKSQKAAFDIVNLLYYLLFDEEKYSSFDSFRSVKNRHFKK